MRQRQISAAAGGGAASVSRYFTTCDADVTLANVTTAQNIFPAAQDTFTAAANMLYRFAVLLTGTNGATACTKAFGLAGTAVIASIRYVALAQSVALNAAGATQNSGHYDTAASTVVVSSGTTSWWLRLDGIMRITTAGTIIPQILYNIDPTGTILIKKDSYMIVEPMGTDTAAFLGAWT
jgi:hypothetical protein